jgi:site-specific recombinase XerD
MDTLTRADAPQEPTLADAIPNDRNPALVYLASLDSPLSRRTMGSALGLVAEMLTGSKDYARTAWHHLRYPHVMALRARLTERLAPRTVNRMLTAVRGVARQAKNLRMMPTDEWALIDDIDGAAVDEGKLAGRDLAPAEVAQLFAAVAGDAPMAVRDRALLAFLFGAALRRSEITGIKLRDYNTAEGVVEVLGKGRKTRSVQLPEDAQACVMAWRTVRGTAPGPLLASFTPSGSIKRRADGTLSPLTATGIYMVLARIAKRAGVEDVSPHDARRTRTTQVIEEGATISHAQVELGHKHSATTDRYNRKNLKAAHDTVRKIPMLRPTAPSP